MKLFNNIFLIQQKIEPVPFCGAPCSAAAGTQYDYRYCRQLLRLNSTTGRLIDNRTGEVFFNYLNQQDGFRHQVWMDDSETMVIKYELANDRHLLGIGMQNVDYLDFSANTTKEIRQDTRNMWNAMKIFHSNTQKILQPSILINCNRLSNILFEFFQLFDCKHIEI